MREPSTLTRAILVATMLSASAAFAEDHGFGGGGGGRCDGCLIGFGVVVGVVDAAFLAVGIPTLAVGDHFGPGWSIVELLWGTIHALVGIIVTPLGALGMALGNNDGPVVGTGILVLVVAAWMITHGIISLKRYFGRFHPPPVEEKKDEQKKDEGQKLDDKKDEQAGLERFLPAVGTSLGSHGASVGLTWSF